ncbi:Uncharacterised protein [Lysinibacillus capsici]|uniref:Uncharacterized protein n=1 Tax=Lysinibacillus capsici TaxID=2115968 RepID=A0A2X0Z9P7_9BACI|nr:Uncharacterised protein [Lysinibacillus capsici]
MIILANILIIISIILILGFLFLVIAWDMKFFVGTRLHEYRYYIKIGIVSVYILLAVSIIKTISLI